MTVVLLPSSARDGEPLLPTTDQFARLPLTPRAEAARDTPDAQTPWWAIEVLDLSEHLRHIRVRYWMSRRGMRPSHRLPAAIFWEAWADILEWARASVMRRPLEEWRAECERQTDPDTWEGGEVTRRLRAAALHSPRAFCQIVGLQDEIGDPITLKGFQVQTVQTIRGTSHSAILLPYEFGKSYLNNILIPLMDWAEWRDASEARVVWNDTHATKWIRRLMGLVENSRALHQVFPWIAKPRRDDPGAGLWSTRGFSIAGRSLPDRAFESLTASRYSTGNRYNRICGDDWVNVSNAGTFSVQDRLHDYWRSGPETMAMDVAPPVGPYGTRWPSVSYMGTLFDQEDVGSRIFAFYRDRQRRGDLGYRALRFDCWVAGTGETLTIWPEKKSASHMQDVRQTLGERVFNMRCRNIVGGAHSRVFPRTYVIDAEYDGKEGRPALEWGVLPEHWQAGMIGFDPGRGRITRESKHPAYFVYCQVDQRQELPPGLLRDPRLLGVGRYDPSTPPNIYHDGIEWGRIDGSFLYQIETLIELAHKYKLPIAVEDNNLQVVYEEQIRRQDPSVRVVCHTTGPGGADPKLGVEQFEPLFKNGRIRLHCYRAPMQHVIALRDELLTWKGRYTDIVMAMWIARHQAEVHFPADQRPPLRVATPRGLRLSRGLF
jgi:hypothetical protein